MIPPTGQGVIELADHSMRCPATDGKVSVVIIRGGGSGFPAEVSWEAVDGDAIFNQNYLVNEGGFHVQIFNKALLEEN